MRMSDIIVKKREGNALSEAEIQWLIRAYTAGEVPDYQMSALCMAIYFRGMNEEETAALTLAMARSGELLDLSGISGVKADKHSTGGVGDKTSLVLCPMLAACGVKMAKMSGRGLGHTGGTIDKLESIPGFSTAMSGERFREIANTVGMVIAGQTANICPADKKMYSLRDVTGTVPSKPLIVSSIMSKKLAAGADVIVLDVKVGSGSFMRTAADAEDLARQMVAVGRRAGRRVVALVTDMDEPLGLAVGNALEVKEAIQTLSGGGPADLKELCLALGSQILLASGLCGTEGEARSRLEQALASGAALEKFRAFIRAQGGDARVTEDMSLLPAAPVVRELLSPVNGCVASMNTEGIGLVSMHLGGGRATKEEIIDPAVGLVLRKKISDAVRVGEPLAQIHAPTEEAAARAAEELMACYGFSAEPVSRPPLIRRVIS